MTTVWPRLSRAIATHSRNYLSSREVAMLPAREAEELRRKANGSEDFSADGL